MVLYQESNIQTRTHIQYASFSHASHCQFHYTMFQRDWSAHGTQDNKRLQVSQLCFISSNSSHTFVDTPFFFPHIGVVDVLKFFQLGAFICKCAQERAFPPKLKGVSVKSQPLRICSYKEPLPKDQETGRSELVVYPLETLWF